MPQKSSGAAGIGILLQVSDGATPTPAWATVANVTNLSAGGRSINMIASTHLDSPDFYAEAIPGLKTGAPWTGTIQFNPTDPTLNDATGLERFFEDRTKETFRINASAVWAAFGIEIDGYVNELGPLEIQPDGLVTQTFSLTPVGKPRRVIIS